jgi:hypothetical protein
MKVTGVDSPENPLVISWARSTIKTETMTLAHALRGNMAVRPSFTSAIPACDALVTNLGASPAAIALAEKVNDKPTTFSWERATVGRGA